MVFLGDSTCLCGIRPLQFENSTGMKAYNVGSMGVIGIDGAAVMLRSYLKHHPKPKIAVFAMSPWALGVPLTSTGPAEIRDRFFTCYQQREDSERAPERPLQQQLRDGIWRLYGLLEGGAERYANASIPRRGGLTFRALGKTVREQRGYLEHPGTLAKDAPGRGSTQDPFPVLPEYLTDFRALARFAREQDVPLLIRLTPSIQDAPSEKLVGLRAFFRRLKEECPEILISTPEVLWYDGTHFGESLHCNRKGAERFTAHLAVEITGLLAVHASNSAHASGQVVAK